MVNLNPVIEWMNESFRKISYSIVVGLPCCWRDEKK